MFVLVLKNQITREHTIAGNRTYGIVLKLAVLVMTIMVMIMRALRVTIMVVIMRASRATGQPCCRGYK